MDIKRVKRPWEKSQSQGARHNPDPFYHSTAWKNTRKAFLRANPLCQDKECQVGRPHAAEMVDHKERIKTGGDRLDWNNLQGLCNAAHARKSARESNEAKKAKKLL